MPHGGNQRDFALGSGTHDDFVVETPEVFQTAAATGDDQYIRPCNFTTGLKRIEAANGVRHFLARTFALHLDRPDDDMHGKAIRDAVKNIANNRTRRRGDDADDARHERQATLAFRIKQPFRRQTSTAIFEQRHQRAGTCRFEAFYDDLVFRGAGKVVTLPVAMTSMPSSGRNFSRESAFPDHRIDASAIILQREIGMTRRMRTAIAGNLAAHPHLLESRLHRALDGTRQFGHRELGKIAQCCVGEDIAHARL